MEKELKELRAAIEHWRTHLPPGKKTCPAEIKRKALALLKCHPAKSLANSLGLCASQLYAWRRETAEAPVQLAPSEVLATKAFLGEGQERKPAAPGTSAVARIVVGKVSVDVLSIDALVALCLKMAG